LNARSPDVWADRCEILQNGQLWAQFYNACPKFCGADPKKILEAKNMQNLARFWTTSKLGGKYLRNGWRYLKSDSHSVYHNSSCIRRNKSGEVWSSDLGDLDVESYLPKVHYLEDYISAPRGCCAPKFLHVLENDQVLLSHSPPGMGAPLTTFFKRGSKIGLKWNKWSIITSELGGVARRNFCTWRVSRWGVGASTTFGSTEPLKIWEGKKHPKFSTFYDNFRVWPQISLNWIEISTSGKRRYQIRLIRRWTKKTLWNSVYYKPSYKR